MIEQWADAETYYNETKRVNLADMSHRVSCYSIIVQDKSVLLVKTSNNKWYFPGGGLNVGESIADGLKREAWEELGVEIQVGELLYADDMVYYHDPIEHADHLVRLFYRCYTQAREFHFENAEERAVFVEIGWVSLDPLEPEIFLPSTYRALTEIKNKLG